jgi:hypothetical protein
MSKIKGRNTIPKENCCGKKVDRSKPRKTVIKKVIRKRK